MGTSSARLAGAFALLCTLLTGPLPLSAAVVALDLPTLADRCEQAVTGTVVSVASYWNAEQTQIYTGIQIQVEEDLKGNFYDRTGILTLTELGGAVGEDTMLVTDTPSFNVGEQVLIFTERLADGRLIVLGRDHAKFTLTPAPGIELDPAGNRLDTGPVAESGSVVYVAPDENLLQGVRELMIERGFTPHMWPDSDCSVPGAPADPPETPSEQRETAEAPPSEWEAVDEGGTGAGEAKAPVDEPDGEAGTRAGECRTGGCTAVGSNYPTGTFSTTSSAWTVVATNIYAGEYANYSVTSGSTYEWSLCTADGGSASYDSQLTLSNVGNTVRYCYSDDYCGDDAAITWTATFTGTVRVMVNVYNCMTNSISTTLVWRCSSCSAPTPADLTPYQPGVWNDKIPIEITQLAGTATHSYTGPWYDNQTLYYNWASLNQGGTTATGYAVHVEVTGTGGGTMDWTSLSTAPTYYTYLTTDQGIGPLAAGSHTFKVWVDYTGVVSESNETNNYYERTITVTAAARPCTSCTPADSALGTIGTGVFGYSVTGNCGNGGKWVGSFTGEAGYIYHWDLCPDSPGSGTNSGFDPDIKILNSSCAILTGQDGSCTAPTYSPNDFQWTCTTAGTYYVIIAPYNSYASHTCTGTSANTFTMYYYKAPSTPTPNITGVSPNHAPAGVGSAGPAGSLVTVTGTAFGSSKLSTDHMVFWQTGTNYLYDDAMIVSWNDTTITCYVPAGCSSKDCAVYKNAVWSNFYTFTVDWSFWYRWLNASVMPLPYYVNQTSSGVADAITPSRVSAQTWENVASTYLDHSYRGTSTRDGSNHNDGYFDIAWRSGWPYSTSTIAQTTVSLSGGIIVETDMEMNATNFTWSATGEAGKMDIQNIVTHEAGHGWVGLSDLYGTADAAKTMFGTSATGETFKRDLAADDIAGTQWIYPQTTAFANDGCAYAVNIASLPAYVSSKNASPYATDDYTGSTCDGPYKNVWWKVTGTGDQMIATTCSLNTTFDTEIAVYDACGGNQVACNDDDNSYCAIVGNSSTAKWCSVYGQTYYISVGSYYSSSVTGSFEMQVLAGEAAPASPTAGSATPSVVCQGGSTSLSCSAPGAGAVDWYSGSCGGTFVGTGNPLTGVAPAETTTYYARARSATSGCLSAGCTSTTVTVNPLPATPTGLAATPSTVCAGQSSTLSASVGGGETVDWFADSCGGTPVASPVSPTSTTTYYAQAHNSTTGCLSASCDSVTVTVSPAPTNDVCGSATAIGLGSVAGDTSLCASVDTAPTCNGYDVTAPGVWYAVTGTGNQMTASTCGGAAWDTKLSVYQDGCGTMTCVTANDDACESLQSRVDWCSTYGVNYLILMHGYSSYTGPFTLTVSDVVPVAPSAASADPTSACQGASVQLSATGGSGGTLTWYAGSCSGTAIGTGASINITAPVSDTTYYVRAEGLCVNSNCAAASLSVTPGAVAPSSALANPNAACAGQGVQLSATGGSGGTLTWYAGDCSGTAIGTGASINITAPASDTTYYVRTEGACGNSSCASTTLTITPGAVAPTSATVDHDVFCEGAYANVSLSAVGGSGGTLAWYSGSCGGTYVGSGTPLSITAPAATTTYYARWESACGDSACQNVTVTVNAAPAAPSSGQVNPGHICAAGTATISASVGGGETIDWYTGGCSGTFVGSGASYNVSPAATTTYYGRARNSATGCTSGSCVEVTVPVDTAAPTWSTTPSNITQNADAGGCTAAVTIAPPTATDNYDPSPTVGGTRSDSLALGDPYPATGYGGPVTITWTATDSCGLAATHYQTVTIEPYNDLLLDLQLRGLSASVERCISFQLVDCGGSTVPIDVVVAFSSGSAVNVPALVDCGDYDCILAQAVLHSLTRRLSRGGSGLDIASGKYVARFTDAATGKALICGDLYDDDLVDIVDFGTYISEWGHTYGGDPDTGCSTAWPHADISGDAAIGPADYAFISSNFLAIGDSPCCGAIAAPGTPRTSITMDELRQLGLGRLAVADLNGDGVLDTADIQAFLNGAVPQPPNIGHGHAAGGPGATVNEPPEEVPADSTNDGP